jgi:hypothetical protein
MTDRGHLTEYKISRALMGSALTGMLIALALAELKILNTRYAGAGFKWGMTLVLLALIVWVLGWIARIATLVTDEAIGLRRMFYTLWIPWSQVQDIAIEFNAGAVASAKAPKTVVALYDQQGRRRVLPHLNDRNMAGHGRMLNHEVSALRARWERERGPDWAPVQKVAAKAARRQRHPVNSAAVGLMWAMLSMPVAVIVFMVLLFTDNPQALGIPAPLFILLIPVVVLVLTSAVKMIKRQRR